MKLQVMCSACKGTGVYVGFAESQGSAVVCYNCKGTGCAEIEYVPFTERRKREGVKTVATRNHGIGLAPGIDQGEVSYEDFLAGVMPTDDETLYERVTGKPERN